MCNLQTYLLPKSSWHCFLVLFSFFLLFFACTTTESDQNGDQLARRMTGGQKILQTFQFYARIYTFSTKPNGNKKPVTKVVRRCAGAFISYDLVLTALQCVLLKKEKGFNYTTVVHQADFREPLKGITEKNVVNVLYTHESPHLLMSSSNKYDVVLLQTEQFHDGKHSSHFSPLAPCYEEAIPKDFILKMIGMTKTKDRYTIKPTINGDKQEFSFDSGFIQEAPFRKVDATQLFKYVYKSKKFFIKWLTKKKPQTQHSHRIVVFSDQGARMDEIDEEIGSPAFIFDTEYNASDCLYGVLSGFISGQPTAEFSRTKDVPNNGRDFLALNLEAVYFYNNWLTKQVTESEKRWKKHKEKIDGKKTEAKA